MSRFFRRSSDSSDDDKNPVALSELSDSPDIAPTRTQHSHESSSGSFSSSETESCPIMDYPSLPVPVSLIPIIRGQQGDRFASPPKPLPAALVKYILKSVPSLDLSNEEDLHLKFTYKRYKCDGIDIWLQAIDPETGDSLVHVIARSGRIGAFRACQTFPTCGNRPAQFRDRRERYLLFMHQNREGDSGLHVAARTGELPLVRVVLRVFEGRDSDEGVDTPGEYERHRVTGDEGRMLPWDAERILFMEVRNTAGRSAAAEAWHHGHKEVASFLEDVINQSYPPEYSINRESARQLARSMVA
ncbi:hypothetical protein LZ31DRAFT_561302 [Colletotrichum somersetense]|nr:hypothetical protein LZ31DRAFT_561302 [Colletotrichum somersetense]